MKEKSNLSKFNTKKQSLINNSKNERGAGRKCIGKTKKTKSAMVYLTEEEAKDLKKYIKVNNIKSQSAYLMGLLVEKGVFN